MTSSRQLAAIMFTDLSGYTALAGTHEDEALDLVRESRNLQKPIIEKHNGTWLKDMGDGALAKFNSAYDSVKCALEIQEKAQEGLHGTLRIGIHLGDITIENEDILGDGVNIASRLESAADPGGIYISESVYNTIKGKGDIKAAYLGDYSFKNVVDPVKTYAIRGDHLPDVSGKEYKKRLENKKYAVYFLVIALLTAGYFFLNKYILTKAQETILTVKPFNLTEEDTSSRYLADGLTIELIQSLGKIQSLRVINPKTSQVQTASLDFSNLVEVDFEISGSIVKKSTRLTISMFVFRDEQQIWSREYNTDIAEAPGTIGQIAADISEAIQVKISAAEKHRITDMPQVNPETYELYLKGMNHLFKYNPEDFKKGLVYMQEAVDKNPADARAWTGLAEAYVYQGHSPSPPENAWQSAKVAALRALTLDSTLAEAWAALAHVKTYFEWDYEGAEKAYHKANELNPSIAFNHYHYAWHLVLFGRMDEAIEEHKKAQQLDPLMPLHTAWLAGIYVMVDRYEEAIDEIEQSVQLHGDYPLSHLILGLAHEGLDRKELAIKEFQKAGEARSELKYLGLGPAYFRMGKLEQGMEILNELKQKPLNSFHALVLANMYTEIDSVDQYFHYVNFEPPHGWLPWERINKNNSLITEDPRFEKLMQKMNLPMPEKQYHLY